MAYIQASFIILRDDKGNDLGSMPTGQAKEYAYKRNMELTPVDEKANPPIYTVKPRQRFTPRQVNNEQSQYEVTAKTVRCTDETGKSLGVIDTAEAKRIAEERGLSLIAINNKIDPPIGRIGDLNKYIYDQKKAKKEKEKKNLAAARATEKKSLKFTSDTTPSSQADRDRILKQANYFLKDGHPVDLLIKFHGREKAHAETSMDRIRNEILHGITEGTVTSEVKSMTGDAYTISCNPAKNKKK
jgi:translation initiation factor IF-3